MSGGARITQVSLSSGGVPERAVPSARVTILGLALQAEGHPITPGSIGENVTLDGTDGPAVGPGTYLPLGSDVVIQVTCYTAPCANITGSFRERDYARVSQKRHAGDSRVYVRVLREGGLTCGDPAPILTDGEAAALVGGR